MDSERINELLEKYWNCETSLDEEKELRAYFREISVPESLKDTASFFRYLDEQKKKELHDTSFEKKVITKVRTVKGRTATLVFNSMRIAAGIVVLVLAVWLVRLEIRRTDPVEVTDTYDNPKMAFEETKKALMMISKSFNTAEEQARKINLFNEAKENLQKETPESDL